VDQFQWTIEA
jgi:hypothetical protein